MKYTRNPASEQRFCEHIAPISIMDRKLRGKAKAQWALYFELMDMHLDYKPEHFAVGCYRYQPDFFVGAADCFVDVLPRNNPHGVCAAAQKAAQALASATNKDVWILIGDPLHVFTWEGGSFERAAANRNQAISNPLSIFGTDKWFHRSCAIEATEYDFTAVITAQDIYALRCEVFGLETNS